MSKMNSHETAESASSYVIGGGSILLGHLMEAATWAQSIAIILGCFVVAVRLAHDAVRFYRYLKEKPPKG